MKKLLYALPLLAVGGCTQVESVLNTAKDQILHPPTQVMQDLGNILGWVIQMVVNLFSGFLMGPASQAIQKVLGL